MEKLSWLFELLDKMSGPADRIAKALKKVETSVKSSANQSSLFSRVIGGIASTFGPRAAGAVLRFAGAAVSLGERLKVMRPVVDVLGKVGAVAGKGLAIAGTAMVAVGAAAVTAVGGLAVAGGRWLIDSIAFKETTLASLEAILGSKQAAENVFNQATKFAAKTPFSTSQVASAFERLVAAGVQVKDLEKTMQSLGDFAGADVNKLEGAISVIAQIRGKGKLQGEELMQLAERGLPMGKVLDELAKKLGVTKDAAQDLLSSGKINAEQGIGAIMAVIDGTFGGRMEKASNTLEGLWSTLKSVPEDILFNPASAAAIEKMITPIKEFIKAITSAFGPDTVNGKRLIAVFDQISTAVAGVFSGFTADGVASTIGGLLDIVEPFTQVFLSFGAGLFRGIGEGFGAFVGVIRDVVEQLRSNPEVMASVIHGVAMFGRALGIVASIAVGVLGAMVALDIAIVSFFGSMIGWVGDAASRVFGFFSDLWTQLQGSGILADIAVLWAKLGAQVAEFWKQLYPLVAKLTQLGSLLWGFISPVLSLIADVLGDHIVSALTVAGLALVGIIGTFLAFANGVVASVSFVLTAINQVVTFFDTLWNDVSTKPWTELGASIVRGIIQGIMSMLGGASGAMGTLADAMMGPLKTAFGAGVGAAGVGQGPPTIPGVTPGPATNALRGPTIPGSDVMTGPAGLFAGIGQALGFGATPAPNAGNAQIQPAAAAGPLPGAQPANLGPVDKSINVAAPNVIINMQPGEDGAAAGKAAATSFSSELGGLLKGIAGEMGG